MRSKSTFLERFLEEGKTFPSLEGYEVRPSQVEMVRTLFRVFEEEKVAIIEAPTGTGKTLGYLLPALEMALKRSWRIVISTNTLPLQDQILKKDLPLACELLGVDVESSMLKGMGNYLCLQKAHRIASEGAPGHLLIDQEQQEAFVQATVSWMKVAKNGHRSEGPLFENALWNELSAADDCTRTKCPHYGECFYFRHRKKALEARVLVINHHLLAMELKRRESEGASLLGDFELLIIDEAHNLVECMTRQLATSLNESSTLELLSRLWVGPRKNQASRGFLATLAQKNQNVNLSDSYHQIYLETIAATDHLWKVRSDLSVALGTLHIEAQGGKFKLASSWQQETKEEFLLLKSSLQQWHEGLERLALNFDSLSNFLKEIESRDSLRLGTHAESLLHQKSIARALSQASVFNTPYQEDHEVAWIEWDNKARWQLLQARFDLAETVRKELLEYARSTLLCSATLGGSDFEPIATEMDLHRIEDRLIKLVLPTNFDWEKQCRLLSCSDMPKPDEPGYKAALLQAVEACIEASKGRILILTTNNASIYLLANHLKKFPRKVLTQGSMAREKLLDLFRSDESSILIGADSFWEGIDLAGKPICLVILVKLPFDVPSDPILEAKSKAIYGKEAFMRYVLPKTRVRFQQGVGRLLRHSKDRGCVVCLDSRLVHARYANSFLRAFAPAKWHFITSDQLFRELDLFNFSVNESGA